MEVFILLFFCSLFAWIGGDDSMSWFVILVVAIFVIGALFSSCSG